MKVHTQIRRLELPRDTLARIEERVRLALGVYTAEIAEVGIHLSPARPDGVRCAMRLSARSGEPVEVEEVGPEASGAADLALWRLAHRLKRRALSRESGRLP
jgi:hypothetical protein